MKELDAEKLKLLYERFRDVCLVEKEVWKEIYLPRDVHEGAVRRTNVRTATQSPSMIPRSKPCWRRI